MDTAIFNRPEAPTRYPESSLQDFVSSDCRCLAPGSYLEVRGIGVASGKTERGQCDSQTTKRPHKVPAPSVSVERTRSCASRGAGRQHPVFYAKTTSSRK